MRSILLTWNPGPDNDAEWTPEQWQTDMVEPTSAGDVIRARWSVGNKVRGIEPGDRAYMYRQGAHGRGIVAVGVFASEPYAAPSWRDPDETAQYADVDWVECVPLGDALTVEELEERTDFQWRKVYSSGREVPGADAEILAELWGAGPTTGQESGGDSRGAGFGTAEENAKIEEAAMSLVMDEFEGEGYEVLDVSQRNLGWDVTAVSDDDELHIEVKGTKGTEPSFFLTANEYRAAESDELWMLVVVTEALSMEPGYWEVDREVVTAHAAPTLYRVQLPHELFEAFEGSPDALAPR